jgi:hypothetical protein
MILAATDPNGNAWAPAGLQERVLHALGASLVRFRDDHTVEVEPDVDLSGYAAALETATLAQNRVRLTAQLADLQKAGCAVVSTGTPELSGTYSITMQDEINIISLQSGIGAAAPWLGWYRDMAGVKHLMTQAQFTALATAILGYVEALDEAYVTALSAGAGVMTLPAQPVTIA